MRSFCTSLLALLFLVAAPLAAQIPFQIISQSGTTIRMETTVGTSVSASFTVLRLSPTIDSIRVTAPIAPFSVDDRWRQFFSIDTLSYQVTFTPTVEGEFYDSIVVTDGMYSIGLVVHGVATAGTRWSVTPSYVDFGDVARNLSTQRDLTFTNNTDADISVHWNRPTAIFETRVAAGGMLTTDTTVTIPARGSAQVVVSADGSLGQIGLYFDTLRITEDLQSSYAVSVNLFARIIEPDTTPSATDVIFVPDILIYPTSPVTGSTTTSMQALIANTGTHNVVLTQFTLAGTDAAAFTFTGPALPVVLTPGDSTVVTVTFDHTPQDVATAQLTVTWNHEGFVGLPVYGAHLILTTDTLRPIVMRVAMTTTDANVGEIAKVTFTNQTALPDNVSSTIVALRYNATILVPETMPLDAEDPIVDGYRTSRFRLMVNAHAAGSTLGIVNFRVALGNSSSTTMEVTSFEWFDDQDEQLSTTTSVNGAVVSVLDAEGNEINVDAGPLQLSVSPTPVTTLATISYERGSEPALLKLYDQMGALAVDLSTYVTAQSGTFTLDAATLPAGVYVLHFTSGRHSYALRIMVD